MKKTLALLLMLAMLIGLCACGGDAASTASEAPAESAAEAEAAPAEEAPEAPAEEGSVAEAAPVNTVEYPLSESYTFTMTTIMRNNVLAMLGDDDFSVTPAYAGLVEGTGCEIAFTALGEATAEEKINIALASGDMTDFYVGLGSYGNNRISAIQDGILFDLAPMLEEYAPDYKAILDTDADFAASAVNSDGSISVFVSQAAGVVSKGILIRQDWLDDVGMEAPTSREALEEVLKAFQSEKCDNPLLMNFGLETGLSASFNVSYAGMNGISYQLTEPNGAEVVPCFASDNFIEYLVYLNYLYEEGLVTKDFMSTGREFGNWESSYYGGFCGVWSDGYRELDPQNRSNAEDPNYVVSPMALTDYECHVSEASTASMDGVVYLTTACEKPELAMQFINYCYTEDGKLNGLYGKEGEGYVKNADGSVSMTENLTNNPNGWSVNNALTYYGGAQWMPTCQDMEYYRNICAEETMAGIEYWTEAYGDKAMIIPSGVQLDPEANAEFNELAADVLTLFSESAIKVVTGDLDEAGYRDVIEQANGMGLTRMTELYQAAYDAYLAG